MEGVNTHEVSLLVRFLAFPDTFAFIGELPSFPSNKGARTQKGFADYWRAIQQKVLLSKMT